MDDDLWLDWVEDLTGRLLNLDALVVVSVFVFGSCACRACSKNPN